MVTGTRLKPILENILMQSSVTESALSARKSCIGIRSGIRNGKRNGRRSRIVISEIPPPSHDVNPEDGLYNNLLDINSVNCILVGPLDQYTVVRTEEFMSKKKKFSPPWRDSAPKDGSWRSIFKWGDPLGVKHPGERLYDELKEVFKLTDEDFKERIKEGDEPVTCNTATALSPHQVKSFKSIVGEDNVSTEAYQKVKYSTGKTLEEAMRLRAGKVDRVCDLVVHPRNREDVEKIVALCDEEKLPVYVYGGGSSVNFGLRPSKGESPSCSILT